MGQTLWFNCPVCDTECETMDDAEDGRCPKCGNTYYLDADFPESPSPVIMPYWDKTEKNKFMIFTNPISLTIKNNTVNTIGQFVLFEKTKDNIGIGITGFEHKSEILYSYNDIIQELSNGKNTVFIDEIFVQRISGDNRAAHQTIVYYEFETVNRIHLIAFPSGREDTGRYIFNHQLRESSRFVFDLYPCNELNILFKIKH